MKLTIGVLFGGESVEHEISIISASQVIKALDESKYNVIPIYISKSRDFYYTEAYKDVDIFKDLKKAIDTGEKILFKKEGTTIEMHTFNKKRFKDSKLSNIDVFFPVLHGTNGEDGSLQGMLEMLDATYTGCDVKGAVNGQDKVFMKNILRDNGIEVVDFEWFYGNQYQEDEQAIIKQIEDNLKYPVIVKPASLGSSIGISKANDRNQLESAINDAMQYDIKIIVEAMVDKLIEVNCAVLGDYSSQQTSVIEQVNIDNQGELLDYADKYQSGGSKKYAGTKSESSGMASTDRIIPAPIGEDKTKEVQEISKKAFRVLNLAGDTRIDYLMDETTMKIYLNEVNTIPGSLAFYLWDKTDIDFTNLCDQLIKLAVKRKREVKQYTTSFDTNVLQTFGSGSKGSKVKK